MNHASSHRDHMRVGGPGSQAPPLVISSIVLRFVLLPSCSLPHPLILLSSFSSLYDRPFPFSSSLPIIHHPPPTVRHPSRSYAHAHRPSPIPDPLSSSLTLSHFRSFTNLARYATISAVSAPVARISEGGRANPYCKKGGCQFGSRVE
jgi:hypothetical protein